MEKTKAKKEAEGAKLLGDPTFTELVNGRFKCAETGHEVLSKDIDSYSSSKRCRLGLIDFALLRSKTPLNLFIQDPLSGTKLKCKLTGDTINKTEEHIWKHINGKRFLNKLEQKELENCTLKGSVEEQHVQKPKASKPNTDLEKKKEKKKKKKTKMDKKDIGTDNNNSQLKESFNEDSITEEEDIWVPPEGDRWDFDDGKDRWGSESQSGQESSDEESELGTVEDSRNETTDDISVRTKRMSIEIGPSSFASRKKKNKKNPSSES